MAFGAARRGDLPGLMRGLTSYVCTKGRQLEFAPNVKDGTPLDLLLLPHAPRRRRRFSLSWTYFISKLGERYRVGQSELPRS